MPNKLIFIQDLFVKDHAWGGAELADDVIITKLRERGHEVNCIHSQYVTPEFIRDNDLFIVSNFNRLSEDCKYALLSKNYIIYEHDSKWNKKQDLAQYKDYKVPPEDIKNFNFYEGARKVILQTKKHLEVTEMNLGLKNLVSAGGNPWKEEDLQLLESLQDIEKIHDFAVLEHPYPQKNFLGAIEYAIQNKLDFKVIYQTNHENFLRQLAQFKKLIFLPTVFETFSRVTCEARCLKVAVVINHHISYQYEDYATLEGMELIEFLRKNNEQIVDLVEKSLAL